MKFSFDLKINSTNKIIKDHGLDLDGRIQKELRDICDRYMDQYIPFETGNLKNNKSYPNNYSIKYNSPYAHYHYKGKKAKGSSKPKGVKRVISNEDMKYQGAPKRGPEWDKRMYNDRKGDIVKSIENIIKKEVKLLC